MAMKISRKIQKNSHAKTPQDYLREPYARVLTPDYEGRGYTAEILEFSGCIAQGDTPDEAYRNLETVALEWINSALDIGQDIPQPSTNQGYAGKIALRLPRSLHRQASQMAERDGTSLNQFLVTAVAERVGAVNLYHHMDERLRESVARTTFNVIKINVLPIGSNAFYQQWSNLPISLTATTPATSGLNSTLPLQS